jgi:hypothetical protein
MECVHEPGQPWKARGVEVRAAPLVHNLHAGMHLWLSGEADRGRLAPPSPLNFSISNGAKRATSSSRRKTGRKNP